MVSVAVPLSSYRCTASDILYRKDCQLNKHVPLVIKILAVVLKSCSAITSLLSLCCV